MASCGCGSAACVGYSSSSADPLGTRGVVPPTSNPRNQEVYRGVIYIYGFLAKRSAPYMLGFSEDDFAVFVST